jgi:hypothetical protein
MTAFNLAEYSQLAKRSGAPLKAGVIDTLRKESSVLELLSFPSIGALKAKTLRIKSLPTVQNRKINDAYTHSTGQFEEIDEQGFAFGGKVQMDRVYDAAKGELIKDPQAAQVELYNKALAYKFQDDFFNAEPGVSPDTIAGMRFRIARDFSGQIVDAGGVDVSPDTAAPTTAWLTLYDKMDALKYKMDGHTCDAFFMSETTLLQVRSGLRRMQMLDHSKDMFGREVDRWGPNGPMLLDAGVKADQITKIMPDTEGATGIVGGGVLSSMIAVKFGEDYLTGWQLDPLQTWKYQLGVIKYFEMDWYVGLAITNPRSVGWLYNITAL